MILLLLLACAGPDPDGGVRTGPGGGGGDTVAEGCHGQPRTEDLPRQLLLSFPYDSGGGQADTWARLSLDGDLVEVDTLGLGRATGGRGVYTPDGQVAVVAGEDGALSSVLGGAPATVGLADGPYAGALSMHPSGEHLFVADVNWPDNGGGLYRVDIDCDTGRLSGARRLLEAKGAAGLVRQPGQADVVALYAKEVPGTPAGSTVHLVDTSTEPPTVLSSADAFGDEEAIVSDAAWDFEGEHLLVADYSEWSGVPTRVAVLRAEGDDLVALGTVEVDDPVAIVTAPYADSSAVVLDGYGNAVLELERTGDAGTPFRNAGTVAGASLPGAAVGISRGALQGQVLVVENQGISAVELLDGGGAIDLGMVASWSGLDGIPGGIALQP